MNGLRTINGIDLRQLNELKYKYNFNHVIDRWPDLIIEDNYLKLKDNNFILLDEITSELFV